ncbi:MAG: hypothetical protein ABL999_20070 [Pyrinomonadaceae bacterium]
MEILSPKIQRILYALCGIAFVPPCLFFALYTVMLIYKNVTATPEEAAAHRNFGMLIGAIAFPLATIVFGLISRWFFKKSWA